MKPVLFVVFICHIYFTGIQLNAQTKKSVEDTIAQRMYWYGLQKPSSLLYVHFDKNIYSSNEYVWFTGYLLKSSINKGHDVLAVALIRNDDRTILAQGKFVMNAGLSFGNMYIPDSLPTGDYSFVCYTNYLVDSNPTDIFIQPVTIREAHEPEFVATLNFMDNITANMDSAKVLVKAYTTDVKLVRGADVNYFIGDRSNPLRSGNIKTNNFGEATITIPVKQITAGNNLLQTDISNGKEMKAFNIKLPVYKKDVLVKFYPEGGNFVNGLMNTMAWEVTTSEGEPLQVKAVLYKDDKPVSKITTNTYGMGTFNIMPDQKSTYAIKLKVPELSKDSTSYNLPAALNNAPVVSIANALTADTLIAQFNSNQQGTWTVMIHNFKKPLVTATIISKGQPITLKIPLDDVPKGLCTFTLLDSLDRPWAERLFFAHFDNRNFVNITTDTSTYGLRQKVEVKFKITGVDSKPLTGLVSIGCAQDNRYDAKKMTDIESYAYLQHELTSLPFRTRWMSNAEDNKEYLENVLLVRGWRRYTWHDLIGATPYDTLQQPTPLIFKGKATPADKPRKGIPEVDLLKPPVFSILKADSAGNFEIPSSSLVVKPGQVMRVFVNNPKQEKYIVRVTDPYMEFNKKIAATFSYANYNTNSFEQTSQSVLLSDGERGKRMLDVVVGSKKDRNWAANICGDYVCGANVLNCPNHPYGGTQPVVGVRYHTARGSVVYTGCVGMKYLSVLDGIYTKKEFYVTDYSNVVIPGVDFFSTMYWNHSVITNDKGEATVTFFTNDMPGKFRITIQGITSNASVVYGEQFFTVKKE